MSERDVMIHVDGASLGPSLDAFMREILECINVRVNSGDLEMMLGPEDSPPDMWWLDRDEPSGEEDYW